MKTRLLLTSMLVSFASVAYSAPPVVNGVTASQRTGTKIVDISYDLVLDTGQTAFVELWFSPDNGLTYPIRCMDIQGDVDANVTGGNAKTVEWNAESDWDQKFTNAGKIRVIATYGDSPSGFGGSGSGGSGGNSGSHDANMKPVPMTLWELMDDGAGSMTWQDHSDYFQYESPGAIGMKIDPKEVTNGLWDEVVQWASDNNAGYTGLTLKGGDPDMPASNITYWQAIKWCNARSEMDGLTPAYYTDADESTGDINGNGQIENGTDSWFQYDSIQDPNQNGKWDAGEPYNDDNGDGIFNPKEYDDYNNNGQYDQGLSQVFRNGLVITIPDNSSSSHFIKKDTDGYRLPSYPVFATAVTGGNYKKNWPWGDQSFPGSGGGGTEYSPVLMHQKYRISTDSFLPQYDSPSKASDRQPNGFDLYDMLGNLAEWEEHASSMDNGNGPTMYGYVLGGSYMGLNEIGNANFSDSGAGGGGGYNPMKASEASIQGKAGETSNAIGFRCMVYLR